MYIPNSPYCLLRKGQKNNGCGKKCPIFEQKSLISSGEVVCKYAMCGNNVHLRQPQKRIFGWCTLYSTVCKCKLCALCNVQCKASKERGKAVLKCVQFALTAALKEGREMGGVQMCTVCILKVCKCVKFALIAASKEGGEVGANVQMCKCA